MYNDTMALDVNEIYMSEACELVGRKPATLRDWERRGVLPRKLRSKRSARGWRYWTEDQIEGIRQWMRDNDMRPGKGLPHYNPDPEQIARHIAGQRAPRKRAKEELAA